MLLLLLLLLLLLPFAYILMDSQPLRIYATTHASSRQFSQGAFLKT